MENPGPDRGSSIPGWWQPQIFLEFSPLLFGEDEPILPSIFFKWVGKNHQLHTIFLELHGTKLHSSSLRRGEPRTEFCRLKFQAGMDVASLEAKLPGKLFGDDEVSMVIYGNLMIIYGYPMVIYGYGFLWLSMDMLIL